MSATELIARRVARSTNNRFRHVVCKHATRRGIPEKFLDAENSWIKLGWGESSLDICIPGFRQTPAGSCIYCVRDVFVEKRLRARRQTSRLTTPASSSSGWSWRGREWWYVRNVCARYAISGRNCKFPSCHFNNFSIFMFAIFEIINYLN